MNALDIRRNTLSAEVRRLVESLHAMAGDAAAVAIRNDLGNAAALLDSYHAGIQIPTSHPATGCLIVQRYAVADEPAPVDEVVLIWLAEDADSGLPWLGHIDADGRWWFVDASIARNVTHWAHRPRAAQ